MPFLDSNYRVIYTGLKETPMTLHPLVIQLHFARSEFMRGLTGVSEDDAQHRIQPMNSLSWIVGHLANQEHRYWVMMAQGQTLFLDLNDRVGYGKPASTPSLEEMVSTWKQVIQKADLFLECLNPEQLLTYMLWKGERRDESIGTMLMRNIYHYWYHIGESQAIRQVLGHKDLAEYVGDMTEAAYQIIQP